MTINQITGTECGTEIAKIINRLISEKSDTDLGNLSAIGQAILDGKSSISLDNLSAAGQAILDKKVEVEALLQQNGYAKFTWKENNQISNVIICWYNANKTNISFTDTYDITCNYPIAYTTNAIPVITSAYQRQYVTSYVKGLSSVSVHCVCPNKSNQTSAGFTGITIGY